MHRYRSWLPSMRKFKLNALEALKIGLGAAMAVLICTALKLPHPASAGNIALLTIMVTTRKQTLSLIYKRLISYGLVVFLCWGIFPRINPVYAAYGLYLFLIVLVLWSLGWKDTLSVNAVFGTVFLLDQDFSMENILLEFCVLGVGITIAFLLNLWQPDRMIGQMVYEKVCLVEINLLEALNELAQAIQGTSQASLDSRSLAHILEEAKEGMQLINQYTQNKLLPKDEWLVPYLELCFAQYALLHVLVNQIEANPIQTDGKYGVVSYIEELAQSVIEYVPCDQLLEANEKLIQKVESFSNETMDSRTQTTLLLVLYNLQDFVFLKKSFLNRLPRKDREEFIKRHYGFASASL